MKLAFGKLFSLKINRRSRIPNSNQIFVASQFESEFFSRNSSLSIPDKSEKCTIFNEPSHCFSQSGYMCMSFNRRDAHVMEVQIGSQTKRLEDACSATNFNISSQSYVTLVSEYYFCTITELYAERSPVKPSLLTYSIDLI